MNSIVSTRLIELKGFIDNSLSQDRILSHENCFLNLFDYLISCMFLSFNRAEKNNLLVPGAGVGFRHHEAVIPIVVCIWMYVDQV